MARAGPGDSDFIEDDEPESDPTDQPARGNDPSSGDGRGSGGTGDVNETEPEPEPEPDPTDQPARGNDPSSGSGRGSGGTGDVNETEPEPEPEPDPTDQPARGNDPSSGSGRGSGGTGGTETKPEQEEEPGRPGGRAEPETGFQDDFGSEPDRPTDRGPDTEFDNTTTPEDLRNIWGINEEGQQPAEQGIEEFGGDDTYVFEGETLSRGEFGDRLEQEIASQTDEFDAGDIEAVWDEEDQEFDVRVSEAGAGAYGAGQFLTNVEAETIDEQARNLEQQFLEENPEFDERDVRIVRDGNTFQVELTASGIEKQAVQENPEFGPEDIKVEEGDDGPIIQLTPAGEEKQFEQQVEATATELGVESEDISIRGDRVVPETEQGEEALEMAAIEEQVREEYPDAQSYSLQQEDDIWEIEVVTGEGETVTGEIDTRPVEEQREEALMDLERSVEAQYTEARLDAMGVEDSERRGSPILQTDLERGEDYTVSEEDGQLTAELTEGARERLIETQIATNLEEEYGVSLEQGEEFTIEETDGEYTAELTEEGEKRVTLEGEEQFGDIDWSFGLGGPEDEVERTIDEAAYAVQKRGTEAAENLFAKDEGIASESAGEEVLKAIGRDDLGRSYEEAIRAGGKGLVIGGTAILNPAGIAGGLMEGVETVKYTGEQTAKGEGAETFQDLGTATVDVGRQMAATPFKSAGLLVGSLGLSTGIMRTAGRVSNRAGLASRAAIQPGEEAAGYLGYGITRRLGSKRAADRLFPQKEPLIFSEEAAIMTGRAAKGKAERAIQSAREGVELKGTARQQELIQRFRPGTATETTAGEGAPGAMSEPLGSPTEGIVSASLRGGGSFEFGKMEAETSSPSRTRTEGEISPEMREMAAEAQAESELAQAIEEFGVNVREFAADESGMASLTGRSRRTTQSEVERTDDRLSDNLYQQAVDRQVRAEYEIREGGSYEGVRPAFEAETEASGPTRRVERAQAREATTESELVRPYETTLAATDTDTMIDARLDAMVDARSDVASRSDLAQEIGQEIETLSAAEAETETRSRLDFETELETEFEQEYEQEFEQEFETEFEQELELETETEARIEAESDSEGRRGEPDSERELYGLESEETDDFGELGSGWYGEFVTAFALGAGPREAPSQSDLESLGADFDLTEQRPTETMLSGTEEEMERIEEAQDFLTFGDGEGLL